MSRPEAGGPEGLADGDRLGRRPVLQQRLQLRSKVERLESLLGRRDLVGPPPAMAKRPAAFALVEAGRVDLRALGASKEEALAMQHVLAAPAHAALALPHP